MDINITTDPSRRTVYTRTQLPAAQTEKQASPASVRDEFSVSPEARESLANQGHAVDAVTGETSGSSQATAFTSFAGEFNRVTQEYVNAIKAYYADEHAENQACKNPSAHIWDKYKNPESPYFRADLSEDERAWAYDQELDLLNGGRHLQIGNPYAFPDGAPTLASATLKANQSCREQISQSIQELFAQNGIDIPPDAAFRLTVDESYTIHVSGLEDEELAESVENALNAGDNGKNLYDHLKITGDAGVDYADGHLSPLDSRQTLDDAALDEVKKQCCPACSQYSAAYNPHQEPMGVVKLPGRPEPSQEETDRFSAAVRVGVPEIIARFRAGEFSQQLNVNKYAAVDPDNSIMAQTYIRAYAQPAMEAKKTIEDYYAAAHRENSSYPFIEGLEHIAQKYKRPDSEIFRSDLSERQRDMYYRQERALLTGSRVTLLDPYALASAGGVLNMEDCRSRAMQAVREKLDALWEEMQGAEG